MGFHRSKKGTVVDCLKKYLLIVVYNKSMAEIEDNEEKIKNDLKKLSDTIHRSPLFASDKKKWKQECTRLIRNTID